MLKIKKGIAKENKKAHYGSKTFNEKETHNARKDTHEKAKRDYPA